MSGAKHTPGPWRVEGRYVMGLKEKTVCELPMGGILHAKVDAANARLIAAAPCLLSACKAALRASALWLPPDLAPTESQEHQEWVALAMMRDTIQAAISKAEAQQ